MGALPPQNPQSAVQVYSNMTQVVLMHACEIGCRRLCGRSSKQLNAQEARRGLHLKTYSNNFVISVLEAFLARRREKINASDSRQAIAIEAKLI